MRAGRSAAVIAFILSAQTLIRGSDARAAATSPPALLQRVVPQANAIAEGSASSGVPFSQGTVRYQQVYSAGEFAGNAGPITELGFRVERAQINGPALMPVSLGPVTVTLSTTAASPGHLSASFAQNAGADARIVYSGAPRVSTAKFGGRPADAGTAAFDLRLRFTTPFAYNPANGNLLLEVTIAQNPSGGAIPSLDAVSSGPVSSLFATDAGAATGTLSGSGLVTQFNFNNFPGPVTDPNHQFISWLILNDDLAGIYAVKANGTTITSDGSVLAGYFFNNSRTMVNGDPTATAPVPFGWTAPLAVANYRSFADFETGLAGGHVPTAAFRMVKYDIKVIRGSVGTPPYWPDTAANEQADPSDYYALFANLAHAYGYGFFVTPSPNLVAYQAGYNSSLSYLTQYLGEPAMDFSGFCAGAPAEVYSMQTQTIQSLPSPWVASQGFPGTAGLYDWFVMQGVAQAQDSNPAATLFAGLATLPAGSGAFSNDMVNFHQATDTRVNGNWPCTPAQIYAAVAASADLVAGYFFSVPDGDYGQAAAFLQILSNQGIPAITTEPQTQTVATGGSVLFTVSATGLPAPEYQWFVGSRALSDAGGISGSSTASLRISNAQPGNAGVYSVLVKSGAGAMVLSRGATLSVTAAANPGRLINLSTLTSDGPGSQLLTLGFVTAGSGGGVHDLLIRGCGPALQAFGVANVLPDPTLTVFSGTTAVAANDNWGAPAGNPGPVTAAEAAVGAFTLADPASFDAALVMGLATNQGYTVQVAGKDGAVGNALAEVYDDTAAGSDPAAGPRLINLSCKQQVSAGGILTAGFTIGGDAAETVLIRVTGPALAAAPFNLAGTMPDPALTVFSGQVAIAANAGWAGDAQITSADTAVGAFALSNPLSKDSAILRTLVPGPYTVQAKSVTGLPGIALIEIYEVP